MLPFIDHSIGSISMNWFLISLKAHVIKNQALVADAQTILEDDLFEKKSVESARRQNCTGAV